MVGPYGGQGDPVYTLNVWSDIDIVGKRNDVTGYVYCITRDGDQALGVFSRRHDERVFFDLPESPERLKVDRSVVGVYYGVVGGYVQ